LNQVLGGCNKFQRTLGEFIAFHSVQFTVWSTRAVASLPRKGFTLYGAPILAADLGARAALVLAGMATKGTAHIEGVSHVDPGYEKLDHQLHLLGASIQKLPCLPFDPMT